MPHRMVTIFFLLVLLPRSLFADELAPGEWRSVDDASTLSYVVGFTFGDVVGRSGQVRVAGLVDENRIEVAAAVPVASFDSGDSRRDRDMRETVDTEANPWIRFYGQGQRCVFEDDRCTMEMAGTLEFGGVEQVYQAIPVALHRVENGVIRAHLSFEILLSDHDVDRPRLLFWRIDDEVMISGTVTMTRIAGDTDEAPLPSPLEEEG